MVVSFGELDATLFSPMLLVQLLPAAIVSPGEGNEDPQGDAEEVNDTQQREADGEAAAQVPHQTCGEAGHC